MQFIKEAISMASKTTLFLDKIFREHANTEALVVRTGDCDPWRQNATGYINTCKRPVTIIESDGLTYVAQPATNRKSYDGQITTYDEHNVPSIVNLAANKLYCVKEVFHTSGDFPSAHASYKTIPAATTAVLHNTSLRGSHGGTGNPAIIITVDGNDIEGSLNGLYVPSRGITVAYAGEPISNKHNDLNTVGSDYKPGVAGLRVVVSADKKEAKELYCNINGTVQECTSVMDGGASGTVSIQQARKDGTYEMIATGHINTALREGIEYLGYGDKKLRLRLYADKVGAGLERDEKDLLIESERAIHLTEVDKLNDKMEKLIKDKTKLTDDLAKSKSSLEDLQITARGLKLKAVKAEEATHESKRSIFAKVISTIGGIISPVVGAVTLFLSWIMKKD